MFIIPLNQFSPVKLVKNAQFHEDMKDKPKNIK